MSRVRTGAKGAAILKAALHLFVSQGVSATSMARIAKAADIAVGTLYLYYTNKDAVIVACAQAFADAHTAHVDDILQRKGRATPRLRDYILTRYRLWQPVSDGSPGAAELAQAILRRCPEYMVHFETLMLRTLQTLLARAVEQAELKPMDAAAAARAMALAVSPFFVFPGNVQPTPLDEAGLAAQIDWFLKVALAP